jgi:hypothetical protein
MYYEVSVQVLTAASMKKAVIWDMVQCSLVEECQRFRGVYCLGNQGDGS